MSNDIQQSVESVMNTYKHCVATPEEVAKYLAVEEQEARQRLVRRTTELRVKWNAPKRHTSAVSIDRLGAWGDAELRLKARLSKGFLVALIGGRGSGKTQLAVELMKEATNRQQTALYATAAEFFIGIKTTYRKDSKESEGDVLARFRKPSILVLDEFGRRAESDWENNLLFELLDKRYADLHNTIILSNHSKEELIASIGASLASRMQETGGIIECNWPSWREQAE